jgi:uncharacterized membrane protein
MTRKDYIATANILKEYKKKMDSEIFEDLVSDFQEFFKADNSNFDKTRFENAVMM